MIVLKAYEESIGITFERRCDLLVRGKETVILERKVRKAVASDKVQLKRYMEGFERETKTSPHGAIVYFLPNAAVVVWNTE